MGGKGSGGLRAGAGRKSKRREEKWLAGTVLSRDRKAQVAPVEEFDAPNDLTTDARLVWMRLAPHAFKARTLTPATEYQFVMLCRNIVLERQLAADPALVAGASHRGIIQRIDAELLRFCLAPVGKPLVDAEQKPVDAFAEFDGAVN